MKTKLSLVLALAAFAVAPALHAADQPPASDKNKDHAKSCEHCKDACQCEAGKCVCDEKAKKEKKDEPKKTQRVTLTGSRLPQNVTRVGLITDSVQPVMVFTQEDLARTGATDLGSALRKMVPSMR